MLATVVSKLRQPSTTAAIAALVALFNPSIAKVVPGLVESVAFLVGAGAAVYSLSTQRKD